MENGILFDLDGTLWETIEIVYECTNIVAKKYGVNEVPREKVCSGFGLNREEISKHYFPNLDRETAYKILDESGNLKNIMLKERGANIYPGVEETIKNLSEKYRLFIISNTSKLGYIDAFLSLANLSDYFEGYVAASALKITKGEAIIKVINDFNIKHAVYVGDTIKDMEASEYAGIPFIQATYGFEDKLNSEYFINNIEELPYVLCKSNIV